ncbi:MAG: SGNH/GDSL hydrolase family protein [Syntrophaceae bacterium]|nr:SGNH/GDSL hydrolase family protein [Syntrophaceae bacterium]
MRVLFKNTLALAMWYDERNLLYRYDIKLGWFPVENSYSLFTGSRSIEVEHNSRGFRDSEHIVRANPRIVFLGDSFVWGYDVEKQERFTEKLAAKFANLSIYNLGVSGYGTDQEYLLLKQHYDYYKPHIVFLIFSNDEEDNCTNDRYGYFKPYFIANGDHLTLQGVPVPKSWHYFLSQHEILSNSFWFRLLTKLYFNFIDPPSLTLHDPTNMIITNMHRFVKTRGSKFIVGLQGEHSALKKHLEDNRIPHIDLTIPYTYPQKGKHWTPDGHTFVNEQIFNYLMKEKYLEEVSVTE